MHECMYVCLCTVVHREKLDDVLVEDSLEKVVQLFSFVTDKDMFGDMYR